MKPLDIATNISGGNQRQAKRDLEHPAELVMETVSLVTRAIRRQMRKHRPKGLSLPQFRALGIVRRHPDVSLSDVARHLGMTTASASKLIDALVKQDLVTRVDSPEDRRRLVLNLTKTGRQALRHARKAALGELADILARLDEPDRFAVTQAMTVLRRELTEEQNKEQPDA